MKCPAWACSSVLGPQGSIHWGRRGRELGKKAFSSLYRFESGSGDKFSTSCTTGPSI